MAQDLIDEFRLMVFPIVLGSGRRLFTDTSRAHTLRLVETRQARDALILIYRPARVEATASVDD